jgi:hypothetical protein
MCSNSSRCARAWINHQQFWLGTDTKKLILYDTLRMSTGDKCYYAHRPKRLAAKDSDGERVDNKMVQMSEPYCFGAMTDSLDECTLLLGHDLIGAFYRCFEHGIPLRYRLITTFHAACVFPAWPLLVFINWGNREE